MDSGTEGGEVWVGVLERYSTLMSSCNSFQDRSTSMCREKVSRDSCLQLTPAQGVYLMIVSCHYLQCMSAGAHEPPKPAKERVTSVPYKYKLVTYFRVLK